MYVSAWTRPPVARRVARIVARMVARPAEKKPAALLTMALLAACSLALGPDDLESLRLVVEARGWLRVAG